ncbi:MAG: GNAT family N-acetyltransferase [Roseovarius sp.]
MALVLRAADPEERDDLSDLCVRSKAYWGYSRDFLEACRDALSLSEADMRMRGLIVAERDTRVAGLAHVMVRRQTASLMRLFVEPSQIGTGIGAVLFDWCVSESYTRDAALLDIAADPGAAPFFEHMGALRVGEVASRADAGRTVPHLQFRLRPRARTV